MQSTSEVAEGDLQGTVLDHERQSSITLQQLVGWTADQVALSRL